MLGVRAGDGRLPWREVEQMRTFRRLHERRGEGVGDGEHRPVARVDVDLVDVSGTREDAFTMLLRQLIPMLREVPAEQGERRATLTMPPPFLA